MKISNNLNLEQYLQKNETIYIKQDTLDVAKSKNTDTDGFYIKKI